MRAQYGFAIFLSCLAATKVWSVDAPACVADEARVYAVENVIDGTTLKLDTGDELRLVGVLAPSVTEPNVEASAFLKSQAVGRKIEVRPTGQRLDRYGRLLGQAWIVGEGNAAIWLQDALVRAGQARVFGLEDRGACETALLAAEAQARDARLGLWANDIYRVRAAETVRDLMGLRGTFQIVEGRVMSVALRGARAYLNFGTDWSSDFTVVVGEDMIRGDATSRKELGRDAQREARRAIETALKSFEGQHVRVRGWVRIRNGPMIEVGRLEDIEMLSRPSETGQ